MSIPYYKPSITDAEIHAVTECLKSGWLTNGARTQNFEQEFAEHIGAKYAIALSSCTAALHLALEAMDVKKDEMIIVPTMTFPGTVEVVQYIGATPVFVDCEPVTLCIDPEAVRRTVQAVMDKQSVAGLQPPYGKLRGIITMHYGGQMADMDPIQDIADEYNLAMIQDAAHALPAWYRSSKSHPWRSVGITGDVTCFSFYANKCITTGEGGMAVTNSKPIADRIRLMSLHGISKDAWQRQNTEAAWEYEVVSHGYKYNFTDIAAAIGIVQLARADVQYHRRRDIAKRYIVELAQIPHIELPVELDNRRSAWHLFPIRMKDSCWRIDRQKFIYELSERGIGSSVHWKPLHLHHHYQMMYKFPASLFPVSEGVWERLISLPIYPDMSNVEIDEVITAIQEIACLFAIPNSRNNQSANLPASDTGIKS